MIFELVKNIPIRIYPFNTKTEKSIIELEIFYDNIDDKFNAVKEILNINNLSDFLSKLMILKIRSISVGPDITFKYKCSRCKQVSMCDITINKLEDYTLFESLMRDARASNFKSEYFNNVNQISEIQNVRPSNVISYLYKIDGLCYDDLIYYVKLVRSHIPNVKNPDVKCFFCHNSEKFNVLDTRFLLSSLSEHTLASFYKSVNYGLRNNISYLDMMEMLPFERDIHINMMSNEAKKVKAQTKAFLGYN